MYIKMNSDKSLVITIPTTIFRGETRADLITFLVPAEYEGINLADCAMLMRYILPDGAGKSEPLSYLPEMYKSYLQFSTIVNTRLTAQDGEVIVWLTAIDGDDGVVLKTGEAIIDIQPSKDIADYFPEEDLDQLDQLAARISELEDTKADNIIFDDVNSTIQLTANGKPIGDKIVISAETGVCVVDVTLNDDSELLIHFRDGSVKNLGKVTSDGGVVYVPHVDEHKILTFTIEDMAGEIPDPVDLNPHDEWSDVDDTTVVSDYIWEDM